MQLCQQCIMFCCSNNNNNNRQCINFAGKSRLTTLLISPVSWISHALFLSFEFIKNKTHSLVLAYSNNLDNLVCFTQMSQLYFHTRLWTTESSKVVQYRFGRCLPLPGGPIKNVTCYAALYHKNVVNLHGCSEIKSWHTRANRIWKNPNWFKRFCGIFSANKFCSLTVTQHRWICIIFSNRFMNVFQQILYLVCTKLYAVLHVHLHIMLQLLFWNLLDYLIILIWLIHKQIGSSAMTCAPP